jgi:hypothetical protein
MSARLARVRVVLRAVSGRTGHSGQAAQRHLSVGVDIVGVVLSAQRWALNPCQGERKLREEKVVDQSFQPCSAEQNVKNIQISGVGRFALPCHLDKE